MEEQSEADGVGARLREHDLGRRVRAEQGLAEAGLGGDDVIREALSQAEGDVTARFDSGAPGELKQHILDRIRSYFGL